MPNYQPISKPVHSEKRWRRYTSYQFAAQDALAPLVLQELPRAAMSLPIGFVLQNENYLPFAVLGLQPGKNLFVGPKGQWIGAYVPAVYRGYPFALAGVPSGEFALVFDQDSGLLADTDGEPFFDDQGNPAAAVKQVVDFLSSVRQNHDATLAVCKVIQEAGLIEPWPITLKAADGEHPVQGLFRINEAALNALSAAGLESLRNAGGLSLAYCQLLSMQHFALLGRLAQAHQAAAAPLPADPSGDLNLDFLNEGGTIRFGKNGSGV
jgi:hypothetical protein